VNHAVGGESSGLIPAVRMPTGGLLASLVDILPKVQILHRVDLLACCVLEVLIGNFSVAVQVEVRENLLELFFGYEQSPMIQVMPKFTRFDGS
jgi:hypothetical protein